MWLLVKYAGLVGNLKLVLFHIYIYMCLCWAMAAIHDQPSNIYFCEKTKQKQMKMQKQRNLLCCCICVAFVFLFSWHHFCTFMRTFLPVSNICCTLPGKKRKRTSKTKATKKRTTCEHKAKNSDAKLLVCFTFFVCFCFIYFGSLYLWLARPTQIYAKKSTV